MAKRQHTNRATPATYIPYGKPEQVVIKRVDYGASKRDRRRGVRTDSEDGAGIAYVEVLSGVSLDSRTAEDTKPIPQEIWHPRGCAGQAGVAALYWRDGEGYCAADYELKFDVSPFFDDALEDPPARWKKAR